MAMLFQMMEGKDIDPLKLSLFDLAAITISTRNLVNRLSHMPDSSTYKRGMATCDFLDRRCRSRLSGIRFDWYVLEGEPDDWYPPFTYI